MNHKEVKEVFVDKVIHDKEFLTVKIKSYGREIKTQFRDDGLLSEKNVE